MKIGIYDMYLDSLGGGEKYTLNIAECLLPHHDVTIFWNDSSIISKAEKRFHLNLKGLHVQPNVFLPHVPLIKKVLVSREYDAIFFMSDGSIPMMFSKKNILMFQFPVNWVSGSSFGNRLKLRQFSHIICNSEFVKKFIDRTFNINAQVISPAVDIPVKKAKKENIILSVGRFTKAMNHKKQSEMIKAFKQLVDGGLKNWKLKLIGSVLPDDQDFVDELKKQAKGYSVEILTNADRNKLIEAYAKAKIYWHATGFGEDLIRHPERAEHFGISTVEAMIEGAVPVVIKAGGQPEIVEQGENGYLWKTMDELKEFTLTLAKDEALRETMEEKARKIQGRFSKEHFCKAMDEIVE